MFAIASELASPFAFTFAISTNKSAVTDSNSCLGERSSLAKAVAVKSAAISKNELTSLVIVFTSQRKFSLIYRY